MPRRKIRSPIGTPSVAKRPKRQHAAKAPSKPARVPRKRPLRSTGVPDERQALIGLSAATRLNKPKKRAPTLPLLSEMCSPFFYTQLELFKTSWHRRGLLNVEHRGLGPDELEYGHTNKAYSITWLIEYGPIKLSLDGKQFYTLPDRSCIYFYSHQRTYGGPFGFLSNFLPMQLHGQRGSSDSRVHIYGAVLSIREGLLHGQRREAVGYRRRPGGFLPGLEVLHPRNRCSKSLCMLGVLSVTSKAETQHGGKTGVRSGQQPLKKSSSWDYGPSSNKILVSESSSS